MLVGGAHKVHYMNMLPYSILSNVIVWNKLSIDIENVLKLSSPYYHCSKDCTEIHILNDVKILNVFSYEQPQHIVGLKWGGGVVGRLS